MGITERQKGILNSIIGEYIELAQPVSSRLLEKKYNFGVCPATIRIEMQKLTDKGFLYQPHTSAGRVPTDKSYRLFVDDLLGREVSDFDDASKIEEMLKKEREDILKWAFNLTKFLAEESSSFAMLNLLDKDFLLKEGWEEILKEPEFGEKDFVLNFAEFLENFEENIEDLEINSGIKIFIGKENPFPKARDFSVIFAKCCLPDEEKGIISLSGPKRMAYDRNISLINSLMKSLEKL